MHLAGSGGVGWAGGEGGDKQPAAALEQQEEWRMRGAVRLEGSLGLGKLRVLRQGLRQQVRAPGWRA